MYPVTDERQIKSLEHESCRRQHADQANIELKILQLTDDWCLFVNKVLDHFDIHLEEFFMLLEAGHVSKRNIFELDNVQVTVLLRYEVKVTSRCQKSHVEHFPSIGACN